jgi:hypothetical protein
MVAIPWKRGNGSYDFVQVSGQTGLALYIAYLTKKLAVSATHHKYNINDILQQSS